MNIYLVIFLLVHVSILNAFEQKTEDILKFFNLPRGKVRTAVEGIFKPACADSISKGELIKVDSEKTEFIDACVYKKIYDSVSATFPLNGGWVPVSDTLKKNILFKKRRTRYVSPNGKQYAKQVFQKDRQINREIESLIIFDATTHAPIKRIGDLHDFAWSQDNTKLAVLDKNMHKITIYSACDASLSPIQMLWMPKKIDRIAWSSYSRFLVASTGDETSILWDRHTNKQANIENLGAFLGGALSQYPTIEQLAGLMALGHNRHNYFYTPEEKKRFYESFPEEARDELIALE